MRTEVILQHGWAFDSRAWWQWLEPLREAGADVILGERGYFGATPYCPQFSQDLSGPDTLKVVVAHSLGLHLIHESVLRDADLVIAISSFLSFHPTEGLERKRSQRVMRVMLEKFTEAPYDVLQQFVENCYHPTAEGMRACVAHSHLDFERLYDDLLMLDENVLDPEVLQGKRLVVAHGAQDCIVPLTASAAFMEALPDSNFFLFAEGGHALPLTHLYECLHLLTSSINKKEDIAYAGSTRS